MNQCTLILADGQQITIDGDRYNIDFNKLSNEEMIAFARQYLSDHSIFSEGDKMP